MAKKNRCPFCGGEVSNWVYDGWGFLTCRTCRADFSATEIEREGRYYKWEKRATGSRQHTTGEGS